MKKGGISSIAMFLLGPLHVYWYGFMISLAIAIGLIAAWINVRKRNEDFSVVIDVLLYCIPLGIIFSRMGYVMLHWPQFSGRLLSMVMLNNGGLSIYGAFIGFLAGAVFYFYRTGKSFWHWMDILLPGMLAALIVDQIGNFCMQNAIGVPLAVPVDSHSLAAYIDFKQRPTGFEHYVYFMPVALYQAMALSLVLLLSALLTRLQLKYGRIRQGNIFLLCMMLAAACRFVFGFMYLSTEGEMMLHPGQYIALLGIICGGIIYWRREKKIQREHTYHY